MATFCVFFVFIHRVFTMAINCESFTIDSIKKVNREIHCGTKSEWLSNLLLSMSATEDQVADAVQIDSDDELEAIATPSFFSSLDEIVEPMLVPSPTPFAQPPLVTTSNSDSVVDDTPDNATGNHVEHPASETVAVVTISDSPPVEIPPPLGVSTHSNSSQSVSSEPKFTISQVLRTLPAKTRFEEHEIRILFNKFSRRWKTHSANQFARCQQREKDMLKEATLVYQTDELEIQPTITSQQALSLVIHHHAQVLLGVLRDFVFTSNVPLRERLRQFHREHPECVTIDDNITNVPPAQHAALDSSPSESDSSSDSDDDRWEAPHDRHVQELIKSPTGAAPLTNTPIKKQYEAAFKPLHLMHDNQRFRSTPQKTPQPTTVTTAYSSSLLSPGVDTMSPLPVLGKKKGLTPLPLSTPSSSAAFVTLPPTPNTSVANLKNAFDRNSVVLPEQSAPPSDTVVSVNSQQSVPHDDNSDPSGLLQRMRHRCEHLDSRASIALLESMLQLMVMASHSGGNVFRELSTECQMWTAADELLCDELVFCANFSLLYQDESSSNTITQRSTPASKMVVQPKPKPDGDKRKEECLVM